MQKKFKQITDFSKCILRFHSTAQMLSNRLVIPHWTEIKAITSKIHRDLSEK